MNTTCKQHVIAYDDPKGETIVYATAYDDDERKLQVMNCAKRHGRNANVRCVLAEDLPPRR